MTRGALIGGITGALMLGIGFGAAAASGVPIPSEDAVWLVLYVVGAAASGALAGALLPFGSTRIGAILVGIVVVQPFLFGILMISETEDPSSNGVRLFVWGIMTLTWGPVAGLAGIRRWQASSQ